MPRTTKEVDTNTSTNKNTTLKSNTKNTTSKKTKTNTLKTTSSISKKPKVVNSTKNSATSKSTASKNKNAKTSKSKTSKAVKSKNTTKSKTSTKSKLVSIIEYYDLPYRYNQTIVKILAQTPNMLFVYWDISDDDRKSFESQYGDDFFTKTKPVLIIHNETMNYSFEIEINDFANSWYLHVNDANCKYVIELGRRPYTYVPAINTDYIFVSSSNEMNAPNNHILFEKFNPNVTYKNTKTGNTSSRNFSTLANYKNMQKIYNIYDLYKTIYKDEIFGEITSKDLNNPSSMSSIL